MIAANANIGVARAAYFPTLTLSAQGGFQSTGFSELAERAELVLGVGPNALLSVFDGGLRRAQVAQARAEFDASAANYRSTVVSAFQQVEDSLATLNHYHDAARGGEGRRRRRAAYAWTYPWRSTSRVQPTTSPSSPRRPRSCRRSSRRSTLDTLQLTASVDLIRALGGGWEDSAMAHNGKAVNPPQPG